MINGNTKISDLSDNLENQNELKHKAHECGSIDKDFYDKLPEWTTYSLDNMDKKFYGRPWFEEAWQKYRDHVMNSEMKNIRAPGYVFNDYIKKDKDLNPTDIRYGLEGDYYLYPELRSEKERREDAKAICYSEEDINSLRHFDENEHPRGKDGKFVSKGFTKADEERQQLLQKQNTLMITKADEERQQLLQKQNTLMITEAKNKELKKQSDPEYIRQKQLEESQKKLSEINQAEVKSVQDIGKGVQEVGNSVKNLVPDVPGKTIRGTYPDMSNQQLQERINRMQLEQRYSDLKGDTKYVKSGQEKTREAIQTITGAVGLATAVITLALLFRGKSGKSS